VDNVEIINKTTLTDHIVTATEAYSDDGAFAINITDNAKKSTNTGASNLQPLEPSFLQPEIGCASADAKEHESEINSEDQSDEDSIATKQFAYKLPAQVTEKNVFILLNNFIVIFIMRQLTFVQLCSYNH
jgi:hypothetical protein